MYVVLTTLYATAGNPGIVDWLGIGESIRSEGWVTAIALANLASALWVFAQLRDGAFVTLRRELAREARGLGGRAGRGGDRPPPGPAEDPADGAGRRRRARARRRDRGREPRAARWRGRRPRAPRPSRARLPRPSPRRRPPRCPPGASRRPPPTSASWSGCARSSMARPIRPDRSKALDRESGGRLDRLDLWIVVVLVAATLGLRMFRLAEPYQMHFDEVYHARTATEFLQDWRYGYSHDDLRVDPSAPREVRDGRRPRRAGATTGSARRATSGCRSATRSSSRAGTIPRPDAAPAAAIASTSSTGTELRSYDLLDREPRLHGADPGRVEPRLRRRRLPALHRHRRRPDPRVRRERPRRRHEPGARGPRRPALGVRPCRRRHRPALREQRRPDAARRDAGRPARHARRRLGRARSATCKLAGIEAFAPGGTGPVVATQAGAVDGSGGRRGGPRRPPRRRRGDLRGALRRPRAGRSSPASAGPTRRRTSTRRSPTGALAGLAVQDAPRVAIADAKGVTFVAAPTGDVVTSIALDGGALGLAYVPVDDARLFVTTGGTDRGRAGRGRDHLRRRKLGEGRPDPPGDDAAARAGLDGPVRRRVPDGPRAGRPARRQRLDDLRHRAARQRRLRRRAAAVRPGGRSSWTRHQMYPSDDRQQILRFVGRRARSSSVDIGNHAFAWRVPGVLAGVADGGAALPARPDPLPAPRGGRPRRDLRPRRRDALRPVADRHERRLRRRSSSSPRTRCSPRSGPAPGAGGARSGSACRSSACCLGLALASKWVAPLRDRRDRPPDPRPVRARPAPGDPRPRRDDRPSSATWRSSSPTAAAGGNLPFVVIMIALTLAPRSSSRPPPDRLDGRGDAVRGRGAGGDRGADRARRGRHAGARVVDRRRAASPSRRSLAAGAGVLLVASWSTSRSSSPGGRASGRSPRRRRRPTPPRSCRAGRAAAARGVAAARARCSACRSSGRSSACSRSRSRVYVVSYLPWATIGTTSCSRAGRPATPARRCVDLTQAMYDYHNNLRAATRRRRRGGPGRSTSSRSGSTRRASPAARPRRSTTPATWSIWWLAHPGDGLRRLAGVRPPQPRPRPRHDRVRSASGCPGRGSTGRRSSTTTTRRCRSCSSPSPTSPPSCGTGRRAGRGSCAQVGRGRRDPGPGVLWLLAGPLCALRRRGPGGSRTPQACSRRSSRTSSSPPSRRRSRSSCSSRSLVVHLLRS